MRVIVWICISVMSLGVMFAQGKRVEGAKLEYSGVQVFPVKDTAKDRQYELYIELPEDYAEHPDKKYPVLYYTDAIWHIEILSASMEYILNDVILVGISWQKDINEALVKEHGIHVSRYRDYSIIPSSNAEIQAKHQLGQAGNHLAFIRNDVIPFVESQYRTDPGQRSYFGYSAGGVFGAYALLSQPDTFKNYILGSPAVRGDIPKLTELESQLRTEQGVNVNVFISYGTEEEKAASYIDQLIELLKSRKDGSLSLTHKVIDGTHQTAFPLTGVKSVTWLSEILGR